MRTPSIEFDYCPGSLKELLRRLDRIQDSVLDSLATLREVREIVLDAEDLLEIELS